MIYDIEGRAYAKLVDPDGAGSRNCPCVEFPHNVLECAYDLLQRKCRTTTRRSCGRTPSSRRARAPFPTRVGAPTSSPSAPRR